MPRNYSRICRQVGMPALIALLVLGSHVASAEIPGVAGNSFTLTAKADRISTPDGNSIYFWGFTDGSGRPQYPGPTLIVDEGALVTISVTSQIPASFGQRISLALPGQTGVTATCSVAPCVQGPITTEAGQGGSVTYQFTASRPGTFLYHSASRPDLQIEMGLTGALIVRPAGFAAMDPKQAYGAAGSAYDQEYLFFLSEMDSFIHDMVEQDGVAAVDQSGRLANYFPNYWFINGRNAPDTMAMPGDTRLPTQPYNSLPRTHPGDNLLMRVVGGGRDMHPFHHHGNHARVIAADGIPLETTPGTFDLSHEVFTIQSLPGRTVDAIFRWTGKGLGWDIYGDPTDPAYAHSCPVDPSAGLDAEGLDATPIAMGGRREYCADHGKKIPVTLPEQFSLAFGGFWSGTPFLGTLGLLPPGEGGLNPNAGYTFMWHSHTEKEMINFDVFPGGLMTMLIIEPIGVPIM